MSRIGKKVIDIPAGVSVEVVNNVLLVTGTKGKLEMKIPEAVGVEIKDQVVTVKSKTSETNLQGVIRASLANMVYGVSNGWSKVLELSGTGYRATGAGGTLDLALGFSHPVKIVAPAGMTFEVKENKIKIVGVDKAQVGELAAKVRKLKPADVYKHKGLKYEGERLIKKAGKAAKAGAPTGK